MPKLGMETSIVDTAIYKRTVAQFRQAKVALPTFSQLADPQTIPASVRSALETIDPDSAHPLNLYRVHWYNDERRRGFTDIPAHLVLPKALTGVDATIVVLLGNRFPMIHAHKVLAAYGCLAPRVITGQFDPTAHKALWPSTGNYCRGGVAISRIMGCRGVAILPAGMSRERFAWLEKWVAHPDDIIRTPGSESNVKEIYDTCNALEREPINVIFNQFCEFGNHLVHYLCTGKAIERVFHALQKRHPALKLASYVSATGSAGTLAAGDYLKEQYGTRIACVEATECPTLLLNGFGEHNIQGIGDKHIPYIHNVMNSDFVVGISEQSTDQLGVLFNSQEGKEYLVHRRHVPETTVSALSALGLSGICNVLAAIKLAKYLNLGSDQLIATIATDGYEMYGTERDKAIARYFPQGFDTINAAEVFGQHLSGIVASDLRELTYPERKRLFNLGYFTWVEQQGVSLDDFVAREKPTFWNDLRKLIPKWDELIHQFNEQL